MKMNLKTVFKSAFLAVAVIMTSCHHKDDIGPAVPPTVEPAPNKVMGYVTDVAGKALAGVEITMNDINVTTGSDGYYEFDDVAPGNYDIQASATGMLTTADSFTLESSNVTQYYIWNVSLYADMSVEMDYMYNEGAEAETVTQALPYNQMGEIEIDITVKAEDISEDTHLKLTPIYNENSILLTRNSIESGEHMLVGCVLTASNPNAKIENPIEIYFNVGSDNYSAFKAKTFENGNWVDTESRLEGEDIVVSLTDLGGVALFSNLTVTQSKQTENLQFVQSYWDNTGGASGMNVDEASFTYKSGAEFESTPENHYQALILEYVARTLGSVNTTQKTGYYPIDVVLPIGTFLKISGKQEKNIITVSGQNTSMNVINYGTCSFEVITASQEHSGGGN